MSVYIHRLDIELWGIVHVDYIVLYENIDQILTNKLHGPMHYTIGVTCIQWTHVLYSVVIT